MPGILPKKRSTEQFRQEVFHLHQGGLTGTHLARTHAISGSTVERWYQDFVASRIKELDTRHCPLVMGIDEHFFNRRDLQVVVMDLSETYRSIIQKHFPNALIVADRFHVVRLLNQHFLKVESRFKRSAGP